MSLLYLHFSYKHAVDGLYRVLKHEGPVKLFSGATMATSRAVMVTIGQIAFYDQIKGLLLGTFLFKKDNEILHFTSSFFAVSSFLVLMFEYLYS